MIINNYYQLVTTAILIYLLVDLKSFRKVRITVNSRRMQ